MNRLPQVVEVLPLHGYRLALTFEAGELRVFDMSPYIRDGTVFAALKDPSVFASVRVALGTVAWSNGADFAPETLFSGSTPLAPV